MRWPDLLEGLATDIKAVLPDFVVEAGTWGIAPNVNAVHIALAKDTPQGMGFSSYTLHIDLFVRVAAGDPHLAGYHKLDEYQQVIEYRLKEFAQATGEVINIKHQSWEPDGGAFVPTYASRLTTLVTCLTDEHFCSASEPLVI